MRGKTYRNPMIRLLYILVFYRMKYKNNSSLTKSHVFLPDGKCDKALLHISNCLSPQHVPAVEPPGKLVRLGQEIYYCKPYRPFHTQLRYNFSGIIRPLLF